MKLVARKAQDTPMRKCDTYSTVNPNISLSIGAKRVLTVAYIIPFKYPQATINTVVFEASRGKC